MVKGLNIILRALEPKDIDILYQWENDQKLWSIGCTTAPFSRHVLNQYIENSHHDIYTTGQLRFMIDTINQKPQTIGMVDLYAFEPFHMRSGVGIMIHEDFRKMGYGSETIDLIIEYAFNFMNFKQLFCEITTDNPNSLTLFKSKGFNKTGTRKEWIRRGNKFIDAYFLQLINKDHI
jgi:diamine N-acetyltransferase